MDKVKIFMSYCSEDEERANKIMHCIEGCLGFEVFLSGQKNRTSQDWVKKIWINLNECDIFMPLLSQRFINSSFANQEVGFALAKEKKIFPISLDGNKPSGLIYHIQAFPLQDLDLRPFIDDVSIGLLVEVFYLILNDSRYKELKEPMINCLVSALKESYHYKITSVIYNLIKSFYKDLQFNESQLKDIKYALENNEEIYTAGLIFPQFKDFLHKHYTIKIDRIS